LGLSNRIRKHVHRNRMLQQNRVSEMPFLDSALTPPVDKPTVSPQGSRHT
jgi:hypothetical protein